MRAVIIEDEAVAAQALQAIIREIDANIEIVAVLQTIEESVEFFGISPCIDLAFMDIHLADGSAFLIFEKIAVPCPVVFTTAYDDYALKAFEVNSIDYILKPIERQGLKRAIDKYRNFTFQPAENGDLLKKLLENVRQSTTTYYKSTFLIPVRDKLIPLAVADIACIYIDGRTVKALTFKEETVSLDQTLDDLMLQLKPSLFFRANRQNIVARRAVKDISIWFGGKLSVNLSVATPERIIVSKARAGEIKEWMME
ncbi:MAG: LytTR family DNA-binding domain-containing protein [Dysgonamonadaceae bacterium]|jgi:two-component system LytT family response regulator|nr:LytTR family DNA-binding domain-containing protein [Dysgonamonadaceae bacterium]